MATKRRNPKATGLSAQRRAAEEVAVHEEQGAQVFLEKLTEYANVTYALRAARKATGWPKGDEPQARNYVYYLRRSNEKFREAWDQAVEMAIDRLEQEAWRRAKKGVKKPVTVAGAREEVREKSDGLMKFLLRGHRPSKFGDTITVQGPDGGPVQTAVTGVLRVGGTKTAEEWTKKAARADGGGKKDKEKK